MARHSNHRFQDSWLEHTVTTSSGKLTLTVFSNAPVPFFGCTRLDGRPIAPADAHALLVGAGHELAAMRWLGQEWSAGG